MLNRVADGMLDTFRAGMAGPHTGRIYIRRGRYHQASAPGEYPANDTGVMSKTSGSEVHHMEAKAGATQYYARFLAHGTSKMARRKFFDNALKETAPAALKAMPPFARLK
jgi:hypothetical protein